VIGLVAAVWYLATGAWLVNVRIFDLAIEHKPGTSPGLFVVNKILTWPTWAFRL
jgi:hypothetical protein